MQETFTVQLSADHLAPDEWVIIQPEGDDSFGVYHTSEHGEPFHWATVDTRLEAIATIVEASIEGGEDEAADWLSVISEDRFRSDDLPGVIRGVRLAMGMSQKRFGELVHVQRHATVSAWENGESNPKPQTLALFKHAGEKMRDEPKEKTMFKICYQDGTHEGSSGTFARTWAKGPIGSSLEMPYSPGMPKEVARTSAERKAIRLAKKEYGEASWRQLAFSGLALEGEVYESVEEAALAMYRIASRLPEAPSEGNEPIGEIRKAMLEELGSE